MKFKFSHFYLYSACFEGFKPGFTHFFRLFPSGQQVPLLLHKYVQLNIVYREMIPILFYKMFVCLLLGSDVEAQFCSCDDSYSDGHHSVGL